MDWFSGYLQGRGISADPPPKKSTAASPLFALNEKLKALDNFVRRQTGQMVEGASHLPEATVREVKGMVAEARRDPMRFYMGMVGPGELGALAERKVAQAAMRFHVPGEAKPRLFTGPTHVHARMEAENVLGDLLDQSFEPRFKEESGFVDNLGGWLSRNEAGGLAKKQKQLGGNPKALESLKRNGELKSEALKPADAYASAPENGLLAELMKEGGATLTADGKRFAGSGFAVADPAFTLKTSSPEEMRAFLQRPDVTAALQQGKHIGKWTDPETGVTEINLSDIIGNKSKALRLGSQRGEKAVGHLKGGEYQGDVPVAPVVARDLTPAPTPAAEPARGFGLGGYVPEQKPLEYFRGPRTDPAAVAEAYERSRKAFRPGGPYKKYMKAGSTFPGAPGWYDTRGIYRDAADAIGPEAAAKRVNDLLGLFMPASTARSSPPSNLKRAFMWQQLHERGLITPEMMQQPLDVPAGFGHFAQSTAHQPALARAMESGAVDPLINPKPASFGANLTGNMKPGTFDTVMGRILHALDPKTEKFFELKEGNVSPRSWAYQPFERGLADAAEEAAGKGLLDLEPGIAPTASYQSIGWHGATQPHGFQGSMNSADYGSMYDIWNAMRDESARLWGVTPAQANEMIWKEGRVPLLPLDTPLKVTPRK